MIKVRKEKVSGATIGSDIEYFLADESTSEIVSAEGIIKGTKTEPYHFDEQNKYFATSLDNVMAEGNIPPSTSAYDFYKNVERLREYINSVVLPNHLTTVALPSARLDQKWLQTENASIFGCDPSLNCWTREEVRPQPTGDNVRSAGFHIHVGYNDPTEGTNYELAKAMDLFLGVPSVLLEPENERKAVGYGLSGNFRNQPHGMEYRSLSSYFTSSRELLEWAFNNTQAAIDFVNNDGVRRIEFLGNNIQNAINSENKEAATALVSQFGIKLL